MKKKIIAGICIVLGIAITVVPFYYHFHGQQETDKLMEQFEQSLEDDEDESEEEVAEVSEEGTSISEEDAALLSEQEVIGIIEIEALDLKYPIVEGADSKSIAYAIGHMSETAGIGEKTLKETLSEMVDRAEKRCDEMKQKLFEVKEDMKEKATEIITEFKKKGKEALNKSSWQTIRAIRIRARLLWMLLL